MSAAEAELWFWRYSTETIHEAGTRSNHYHLIKDEDVVRDPTTVAKRLFDFCDLEWSEELDPYIIKKAMHWQAHTMCWPDGADPVVIDLLDRVLSGSKMADWWSSRETVSLFRYAYK